MPNRLAKENSLYLRQHANNPVDWHPWSDETLEKAKKENKLIFISIGYSACHWCHVMERETFTNQAIADLLNRHFISIKVDREERPDIDQIYMSAIQLMTGSGGWPLSCFATHEGKPFYGGTYYPAFQFREICEQLAIVWKEDPQKILTHAEGLCDGINNAELIKKKSFQKELCDLAPVINQIKNEFDTLEGGLSRVPKFPLPSLFKFLIRYYHKTGDKEVVRQVNLSLHKMIKGGIYDQLGGGMARYSTDKYWFVPHFEKMLYDNAQFISLLSEAYSVTRDPLYRTTLDHCFYFLENEFLGPDGGYYAAMDADSEGEEGRYYTWTLTEIENTLEGDNLDIFTRRFNIKEEGNWEKGKNILAISRSIKELAADSGKEEEEILASLSSSQDQLLDVRSSRVKPSLDTKVLTSWNALMVMALADAFQSTGEEKYRMRALETMTFIKENLLAEDYSVIRSYKSEIPGFLDDHAFVSMALLMVYQISFEEGWLAIAKRVIERSIEKYFNSERGVFYYSSDSEANPVGKQSEVTDNVIPSSNSVMAQVLFLASGFFDNQEYFAISRQMLQNIQPYLSKSPSFFSNWLSLQLYFLQDFAEIVITGENYRQHRKEFCGNYLPDALIAGAENQSFLSLFNNRFKKGQDLIYVCRNRACKKPVHSPSEALEQLRKES